MPFKSGHAVIVGVGGDLPITVKDATIIASLLQDTRRCAFPESQVKLLTGADASRKAFLDSLNALAQSVDQDSTAIIYFSGHGYRIVSTDQPESFYLLTHGYELDKLPNTCINGREFTESLRAIRCKRLLVLLDCCHAGGIGQPKTAGVNFAKSPLPLQFEDVISEGSGRVIIASSRADEKSYIGNPYSVFTLALLEGLVGAGASEKDGFARVLDVALYVARHVPDRTKDKQHPILKVSNLKDNYAIAYYASGAKDPLPFPQSWGRNESALSASIDAELAYGYRKLLQHYQSNLLELDIRISEFIDQRSVPPDFWVARENILKRIRELEHSITA